MQAHHAWSAHTTIFWAPTGPMLSPRVPNLVPMPGPRMARETPGQRPRPNYGHPHGGTDGRDVDLVAIRRRISVGRHDRNLRIFQRGSQIHRDRLYISGNVPTVLSSVGRETCQVDICNGQADQPLRLRSYDRRARIAQRMPATMVPEMMPLRGNLDHVSAGVQCAGEREPVVLNLAGFYVTLDDFATC